MANEKRLLDPSELIRDLTAMKSMYDAIALDGIIKALKEAPTVDAVEVVRCENCKYFRTDGCAMDRYSFDVTEEGFCSYGERREGE